MAFKGSFLGFSYGKTTDASLTHSSSLGIVRTSDGDRFNDTLLPNMKINSNAIEGNDGMYYFGTSYSQRSFTLSFAFDGIDDSKLRQLRQIFGEKGMHKLILDEFPYKVYYVTPNTSPTLKYMAFDTDYHGSGASAYEAGDPPSIYHQGTAATGRLYRGEGAVTLTTYQPWASSVYKYSNQYTDILYPDKAEWFSSVGLKASDYSDGQGHTIDTYNSGDGKILIYNPGDLDTDFKLNVWAAAGTPPLTLPSINIHLMGSSPSKNIIIDAVTLKEQNEVQDTGYQIDTKLRIIQGIRKVDGNTRITGTLYNQYITSGDFFKIPVKEETQMLELVSNLPDPPVTAADIEYNYLFY